jgi:hypothetical protein
MQLQIWIAGLGMGVEMKTRVQKIKKRAAKAKPVAVRNNRPQKIA